MTKAPSSSSYKECQYLKEREEELLGDTRMGIKRAIVAMVALSINVN